MWETYEGCSIFYQLLNYLTTYNKNNNYTAFLVETSKYLVFEFINRCLSYSFQDIPKNFNGHHFETVLHKIRMFSRQA